MKAFDNLKEIWQQQSTGALPDVTVIINKAKKEQQSMTRKIGIQVGILMLTIVFLSVIFNNIAFKKVTTFIGIGLMFFAMFGYSALRLYQINTLRKVDLTASPKVALTGMQHFYRFQQKVNTTYTQLYYIVLNTAFVFYFIEVMQPLSTTVKIVTLVSYVTWMLIAYFIIGKKYIRKEHAKTESIITALQEIEANYEK
ncbi:hypothetical protein [Flavobacterium sp.]|uniref:hypothetical protein n=1 Tax=Flavobacterium sp. TaxID=239 RepID=UPI00262008C6|nr:hypothetical protein [Flavobacterium sp.]